MDMDRLLLLALLTLMLACGPEPLTTVVLSPETPEVAEVLRDADARWEAAGVAPSRIEIGPGGAPVRLIEPEGDVVGETRTIKRGHEYAGVRWMTLSNLDPSTALHELGHAMGIGVGFERHPFSGAECDRDAAERPLMCPVVGDAITERDLLAACEVTECTHFSPEVTP